MADWPPLINSVFTVTFPIYDNDGDPVTAAAALDSETSLDGAAFGDATNEATEISGGRGVYTLLLTSGEMNGDIITTITISTTTDSKDAVNVMYTVTRQLINLAFPTVSGRSIDVEATGEVGLDLDNTVGDYQTADFEADFLTAALIANGAIDAATFAAGAIDAAAIATDAIDADALAADAVAEIQGAYVTGTSDAGGSTITMIDAALTELDDVWIGSKIKFTSGAIDNQTRIITEFVAATDTVTFAPAVTASVGAGFTYEIHSHAPVDLQSWVGLVSGLLAPNALIAGAVDADVSNIQNDVITAASIAVGAIAADAFVAGAIDAAAIAADAIGAAEIANGAIDAATFAAGAIDAAAIATDAIDDDAIATGAIASTAFAAGAIDAAAIAANAITSSEFAQSAADLVFSSAGATMAEIPQGVPSATPRPDQAQMLIYMALRNRLDIDTGGGTDFKEIYNDAGVVITKKALTDDGTVYSEAEVETGP